jgi:hypothetical protein
MAEIVQSLFGVTPEMYRQQQNAAADQRALALAQLSPMQRAEFNIARGAYGLGGALAGALGAQDPQLQLVSSRNAIARQIDMNDPASIQEGVRRLTAAGDTQGAMMLADVARKALSERALIAQRTREAATKDPIQELLRAGKYTPESVAVFAETGDITALKTPTPEKAAATPTEAERNARTYASTFGAEGSPEFTAAFKEKFNELITKKPDEKLTEFQKNLVAAGLTPGSEPFIRRMNEYISGKIQGAAKGAGNVTIGGITFDTGAASKEAGKIVGTNVANVEQQYSLQTAFTDALKLLDQGIYGGAFGPERQFVAKFVGIGNPKKVQNTEVFMANIGEIVIPRLQQFGGNDSNEELKYLQKVVAGDQRLEPESMRRILASAEKKVQKNLARLQQQVSAGQTGGAPPIGPVAPVTAPAPTKRYNPQTRKIEPIGD